MRRLVILRTFLARDAEMNWHTAVGCRLASLALASGGCGTIHNLQHAVGPKAVPETPPDAPMKRVYGGVRSDWSELAGRRDTESRHPGTGEQLGPPTIAKEDTKRERLEAIFAMVPDIDDLLMNADRFDALLDGL